MDAGSGALLVGGGIVLAILGVLAGAIVNRVMEKVVPGTGQPRPRIEVANGVLWLLVLFWCAAASRMALLPLLLVLSSAGLALFVIDVKVHRLPNPIVMWLYPITVLGLVLAGLLSGEWPFIRAVLAALVWLLMFGLIWLVTRGRGMGFGDVKLAPVLGATLGWVGWGPAIVGLFAAWIVGGVFAVFLLVSGRASRGQAVAFGPFMLIGAVIGLVVGEPVLAWYLGTS